MISVIVPAYNSDRHLELCLHSIRQSECAEYELIVVDDGSGDGTAAIAEEFADCVISHRANRGRTHSRNSGLQKAGGDIVVFIDADVVIKPRTLALIQTTFSREREIDAITGLLSREHPNVDFFSQYKNLYMHYIFCCLPPRVNFLYGSLQAMRRNAIAKYTAHVDIADDSEMGQQLNRKGKEIAFVRELEVVHLKKYDFLAFVRNDFRIPFDWADIFVRYRGWRQLGKNKGGYLHSPKWQLLSVILAPLTVLVSMATFILGNAAMVVGTILLLAWIVLNAPFIAYLQREKSTLFAVSSYCVTFFDHCVMATGIFCGLVVSLFRIVRKEMSTTRH